MPFRCTIVAILISIDAAHTPIDVTDSEYYKRTTLLQIEGPSIQEPPSTHYFDLVASTPVDIVRKLNNYASTHASVDRVISCSLLDETALHALASKLLPFVSSTMVLPEDDGRQLNMNPWMHSGVNSSSTERRDTLCAETMKLWAHHIPNKNKNAELKAILPSLPSFDGNYSALAEHAKIYNMSLSHIAGHSVVDFGKSLFEKEDKFDWPYWPRKSYSSGLRFGPHPFWQFPSFDDWMAQSASPSFAYKNSSFFESWHNIRLRRTKMYHSKCMMKHLGFTELDEHSCGSLWMNPHGRSGTSYVYTVDDLTRVSDGKFCCSFSFDNTESMKIGTINEKFVDNMKYTRNQTFHGEYYKGDAKLYAISLSSGEHVGGPSDGEHALRLDVWYETDADGRPLRTVNTAKRVPSESFPFIQEDFDPAAFDDEELQDFPDSVLDLPEVCETSLSTCFPVQSKSVEGVRDLEEVSNLKSNSGKISVSMELVTLVCVNLLLARMA